MSLHNAELETDLFYAESEVHTGCTKVMKRGLVEAKETNNQPTGVEVEALEVCVMNPQIEGAADQVARALNRLPKMEALLIDVAAAIRGDLPLSFYDDNGRAKNPKAAADAKARILLGALEKIEEAICS